MALTLNETDKQVLRQVIPSFYFTYRSAITRAQSGSISDEEIADISQYVNKPLASGKKLADYLNLLVAANRSEAEYEEEFPGGGRILFELQQAWRNIGTKASSGIGGFLKAVGHKMFGGAPAGGGASAGSTPPPASSGGGGGGGSSSGGFFESVGSFFSNGFETLSLFGSSIQAAFKNNTPVDSYVEQAKMFREAAAAIKADPNTTEEQKKQAYKNLVTEAHKRMGMDDAGASKATSYMFDTLKLPVNMITGMFSNAGDFLKEVFTPKERYNIYQPVDEQIIDRLLKPTRDDATSILDSRQKRLGIQNLTKLGLSESEAESMYGYLTHPIARQAMKAAGPMFFNKAFGDERGTAIWKAIGENVDALLHGFQGDGNLIFNQLDQNTFSERTLYSFGATANILSETPSAENGFLRASDYAATIKNMQEGGWDAESYNVRGNFRSDVANEDLVRVYKSLSTDSQNAAKERYIKTQQAKAMEQALKEAKVERKYDENGELDVAASIAGNSEVEKSVDAARDAAGKTAELNWTRATEGFAEGDVGRDIAAELTGQARAEDIKERALNEKSIIGMASQLRGVAEATGGKGIDNATARQLIRALGNIDPNSNDADSTRQAMMYLMYMDSYNMDYKTTMAGASLAGEYGKQLGMSPAMAQQAQLFGATMFGSRMSQRAQGEYVDHNRELATSIQNAERVMKTKDYGDLAWLQTVRLKDGSKLKDVQEKLRTGQPLSEDDWKLIRDDKARREAFDGTTEQYLTSRQNLDVRAENMTASQRENAFFAATRNQKEALRKNMRETSERTWKANVGQIIDGKVYEDADTLRDYHSQLRRIMGSKEAWKILSGQREMTSEEKRRFAEANPGADLDGLIKASQAAAEMTQDQKNEIAQIGATADAIEAKQHHMTTTEMDSASMEMTPEEFRKKQVETGLRSEAQVDSGATFIEKVLGGSGEGPASYGTMAGRALGELFSPGSMEQQEVLGQLDKDEYGMRTLLFKASTQTSSSDEFWEKGWGIKADRTNRINALRSSFQAIDKGVAKDFFSKASEEDIAKRIQEVFSNPNQRDLQIQYAKLLRNTAYGQAVWKDWSAKTKGEREAAEAQIAKIVTGKDPEAMPEEAAEGEAAPTAGGSSEDSSESGSGGGSESGGGGGSTKAEKTGASSTPAEDTGTSKKSKGLWDKAGDWFLSKTAAFTRGSSDSKPLYVKLNSEQLNALVAASNDSTSVDSGSSTG